MNTVDNRVIDIQFNNGEFEKSIKQSIKSLDELKKGLDLDKSAKSLENLEKTVDGMHFDHLMESINKISDRFSTLGIVGMTAIQNITNKVIALTERLVKGLTVDQINAGFGKYEMETKAVQSIMAATRKPVEEVQKVLTKLNEYTDATSFDYAMMAQTIGKFVSSGVDLEVAERAMEGIGNEASKAGAEISEANRAMYNFAQSLASGKVQLIDWKSIENANMATQDFKETIIETAIELGTLKREGDKVGKTTKGTTVDFKSFNATLSESWFTSDVLIKTLEKYADTTTEFGAAAFQAAKETLTFGQAMDAVKDAVSTSWMTTFRLVFGNIDEARQLWSSFGDGLIDFLDRFNSARNELLEGWRDVDGEDGREVMLRGLKDIAESLIIVFDAAAEAFHSIFPATTAEDLMKVSKAVESIGKKFKEFVGVQEKYEELKEKNTRLPEMEIVNDELLSDAEELERFLKEGAEGEDVKKLQNRLMQLGYSLDNFGADGVFGPETRKALMQYQKDMGLAVDGIYGTESHKSLLEKLFPKQETKELNQTNEELEETSEETLTLSSAMQKLQRAAKGAFAVIDIGWKGIKFLGSVIGEVLKVVSPVISIALDIAAVIGDCFVALDKGLEESGLFSGWLETISRWLKPVADWFKKLAASVRNFFDPANGEIKTFSDLWTKLKNAFKNTKFFEQLQTALERVKNTKFFQKMKGFFNSAYVTVGEKISNVFSKISEAWKSSGKEKPKGAMDEKWYTKLFRRIRKVWEGIKKFFKDIPNGIVDAAFAIKDFFTSLWEGFTNLPVVSSVSNWFSNIFDKLFPSAEKTSEKAPGVLDKLKKFFSGLWETISTSASKVPGAFTTVKNFFVSLWESFSVSDKLKTAGNNLKDFFSNIGVDFSDLAETISGAFKKLFGKNEKDEGLFDVLKKIFGKDTTESEQKSAQEELKDRVSGFKAVGEWIKNAWNDVVAWLSDIYENAGPVIKKVVGWLISKIPLLIRVAKEIAHFLIIFRTGQLISSIKNWIDRSRGFGEGRVKETLADKFLKIAGAVFLIAGSVAMLGSIPPEDLKRGMINFGIIAGALAGLMLLARALNGKEGNLQGMGTNLLALSGAVTVLALTAKVLSGIDWGELGDGLSKCLLVMTLILFFIASVKMMKATNVKLGGIMAVAGAVTALSALALVMKRIEWDDLWAGLKNIAAIMGLILAFVFVNAMINRSVGTGSMKNIGLFSVIAAIAILALIAHNLAHAGDEMQTGIDRLAMIEGLLAALLFVVKATGSKDLKSAIAETIPLVAIVGTIEWLSTIVQRLSELDATKVENARRALEVVSHMLLIDGGLSVLLSIVEWATGNSIMDQVSAMIPVTVLTFVIGWISEIVNKISDLDVMQIENAKRALDVIGSVLLNVGGLSILLSIMEYLSSASLYDSLASVIPVAAITGAIWAISEIFKSLSGIELEQAESAKDILLAISGSLAVLSVIAGYFGSFSTLKGVSIGSALILEVGGVLAGLIALFAAISTYVASQVAEVLDIFGSGLSLFDTTIADVDFDRCEKAMSFITDVCSAISVGLMTIDEDDMNDFSADLFALGVSINSFGRNIGDLTSDKVDNANAFIGGLLNLSDKASRINDFDNISLAIGYLGGAIKLYYDSIADIEDSSIEKGSTIATKSNIAENLAALIANMPSEDQIATVASYAAGGGSDLTSFAIGLENMSTAIKAYRKAIGGFGKEKEDVDMSTYVISYIQGLEEWLVMFGEDGIAAKLFGVSPNMKQFAFDVELLGNAIGSYITNVCSYADDDGTEVSKIENSLKIIEALKQINNTLDKTGGVTGFWEGNRNLQKFGLHIGWVGEGIASYLGYFKGLNVTEDDLGTVDLSLKTVQSLAESQSAMAKMGGLISLLGGDRNLGQLGKTFGDLANGVATYANIVSEATFTNVEDSLSVVSTLAKVQSELPGPISQLLSDILSLFTGDTTDNFVTSMGKFAEGLASFGNTTADADFSNVEAALSTLTGLIEATSKLEDFDYESHLADFATAIADFYYGIEEGSGGNTDRAAFFNSVTETVNAVIQGIEYARQNVREGVATWAEEMISVFTEYYSRFYETGYNIMQQVSSGIQNGQTMVINAVANVVDMINSSFVINPVIAPVVDTSGMNYGSYRGSSGVSGGLGTISTGAKLASSTPSSTNISVRTNNSDVVAAVNENTNVVADLNGSIRNMKIVMNTGALVGQIGDSMDEFLGGKIIRGRS